MKRLPILAALGLALPVTLSPLAAHAQSQVDKVVASRLAVSEFMRICVRTDADPEAIEQLALNETWIPDSPSSIKLGLTRVPPSDATVYTFTRSRSTSAGRVRSDVQVVVPVPGERDCTLEFETVGFGSARNALKASGFTEEEDDAFVPENAPTRVRRTKLCEEYKSYRDSECVELAVDPAAYPVTGQITLDRVGGETSAPAEEAAE